MTDFLSKKLNNFRLFRHISPSGMRCGAFAWMLYPLCFLLLGSCFACLMSSCSSTKHVPKDEYLLRKVELDIDNKNISKDEIKRYLQPKPNKKIIGMKFHLWLYNRSKPDKDNKWNAWLRKNGEEPVLWQQSMTNKNVEKLEIYLENRGYYYARVTDTVILKKKKADVAYEIKTGWPYKVNKITYSIPDTAIARLILNDTINSLIKRGMLFDVSIVENESKRIETNLKNKGYFSFSNGYISYEADSAYRNRTVNLEMNISLNSEHTEDNQVVKVPYPVYTIGSLTVNASLSMQNLMNMPDVQSSRTDTINVNGITFIMPEKFPVRPSIIEQSLYIFPDSLYRISGVNRTYQHLSGLNNFLQRTIEFTEPPGQTGTLRELDCRINLLPLIRQGYQVELEGTNSGGNYGGGVSFQYQNKSLFKHAEIFDLKLRGMLEAVSTKSALDLKTTMEYEAEATLNIPKFLLPFNTNLFVQRYNPKTIFSVLYNYQRRPDYTRTVFNTSFGYTWRGSEKISHTVKPIDVNYVVIDLANASSNFLEILNAYPYLQSSYQTHMVVSSSYGFVKNVQARKRDNFFVVRANIESAGLLLNSIFKMTDKPTDEPYKIINNAFSQFVKGDIDMSYNFTINGNNKLVTRIFAGVGWPYGNSSTTTESDEGPKRVVAMPFEKKYFVGGANSIRGWRLRSLGPGSFADSTATSIYPNNTGDIKLEANIEYRFKLVWIMDGALFMDAGNVWDTHKDEDRPGANFRFNRFYREIALNCGVGLRFNIFASIILRTDLGMKLHDPAGNGRWVFDPKSDGNKRITRNDFCLSIGIGHAF